MKHFRFAPLVLAALAIAGVAFAQGFAPQLGISRIFDTVNGATCTFALQRNCGADVNQVGQLAVDLKPKRITYRANVAGLVPAASATDVFYINGSASKTITVNRLFVSGSAGTNVGVPMQVIKRSTATTGGTCAAATNVPLDSADAAATAVVNSCTANPTPGTSVGTVASQQVWLPTTSGVTGPPGDFRFGDANGKPVVLRGTAQGLALNLNGVSVTTGALTVWIEWTEE